jgi:phosphodiesterase/alkaline phosphatase D-like protein
MHSFWVNDLTLNNHQPDVQVLASEFVGTSVSSSGPLYEQYRSSWIHRFGFWGWAAERLMVSAERCECVRWW